MRFSRYLLLVLVATAVVLAGCGIGPGQKTTEVQVTVSRDFGEKLMGEVTLEKVPSSDTVMRVLQRNFKVKTRYGGGFVQSIDGLSGKSDAERPVDWFYYVNGVLASKGAGATKVHAGDYIWWDRHNWSETDRIPAVVGSFPAPFINGIDGKRMPTKLECLKGYDSACERVADRLSQAGIVAARSALGGSPIEEGVLRLLVGPWEEVRKDAAVGSIEKGPKASGVFATLSQAGTSITTLDPNGKKVRTLGSGSGLIAATTYKETQTPVWVITGVDKNGVTAAANNFDQQHLRNAFALVVDPSTVAKIPENPSQ